MPENEDQYCNVNLSSGVTLKDKVIVFTQQDPWKKSK